MITPTSITQFATPDSDLTELDAKKVVSDVTLLRQFFDYACPTHTTRMTVVLNVMNTFILEAILRRLWLSYKELQINNPKGETPQLSLLFNGYPGELAEGEVLKTKLNEILAIEQVLNIMANGDPGKPREGGYEELFPAGFWLMDVVEDAMLEELTLMFSHIVSGVCRLHQTPKDLKDAKDVTENDMDLNDQSMQLIGKLFQPDLGGEKVDLPEPEETTQ